MVESDDDVYVQSLQDKVDDVSQLCEKSFPISHGMHVDPVFKFHADKDSDPFQLDLLIAKETVSHLIHVKDDFITELDPQFTPGFMPSISAMGNRSDGFADHIPNRNIKEEDSDSGSNGDVSTMRKKESFSGFNSKKDTSGFSMIDQLEATITVGNALSWDMSGCEKNLKYIIASNGEHFW